MASYSALTEPMLARSGRLPASGDYAHELKWDGFRAIVSTEVNCESEAGAAGTLPIMSASSRPLLILAHGSRLRILRASDDRSRLETVVK